MVYVTSPQSYAPALIGDQRIHTQLDRITHDRSYITTSSMSEIYEQSLVSQNIRNVILHQHRTRGLPRTEPSANRVNEIIAPHYNYWGPVCDFRPEQRVSITSRCDQGRFADRMMMEGIKLRTLTRLSSTSTSSSSSSSNRTVDENTRPLASIRYISTRTDGYPQYVDTIYPCGKASGSEEAVIEELIGNRRFYRYTDYLQGKK